jgi:hypothetical protein
MISSFNHVLGARAFNFVIDISMANFSIRMTPESSPVSKGSIKLCSVSVTIMFLKEGRPSPTILADGKKVVGARADGGDVSVNNALVLDVPFLTFDREDFNDSTIVEGLAEEEECVATISSF